MTWPAGRHPDGTEAFTRARSRPPSLPGRASSAALGGGSTWRPARTPLCSRSSAVIGELTDARLRRLEQKPNSAATSPSPCSGNSAGAAPLRESSNRKLSPCGGGRTPVDEPGFPGDHHPIPGHHHRGRQHRHGDSVTTTCHAFAPGGDVAVGNNFFSRHRLYTSSTSSSTKPRCTPRTGSNVPLTPGSYLPIATRQVTPAGVVRGLSGQVRDRTYLGSQQVGEADRQSRPRHQRVRLLGHRGVLARHDRPTQPVVPASRGAALRPGALPAGRRCRR